MFLRLLGSVKHRKLKVHFLASNQLLLQLNILNFYVAWLISNTQFPPVKTDQRFLLNFLTKLFWIVFIVLFTFFHFSANAYSCRLVDEVLVQLLQSGLRHYPNNEVWLKLLGDVNFSKRSFLFFFFFQLSFVLIFVRIYISEKQHCC